MSAVEEQPICACGMPMTPPKLGSAYHICPNCDVIQPSEYTPVEGERGKRRATVQDRRFNLEWERRKREFYPNQGKQAA